MSAKGLSSRRRARRRRAFRRRKSGRLTVPSTGGTATYTVGINRFGGYSDGVDLSVAASPALPTEATASFSPLNPVTADSSTLSLTVPLGTTATNYLLTITGTGTGTLSGTKHTAGAALTVSAAPTSVYVTLPSGTNGYAVSGGPTGTKNLTVTVALVNDFGQPVAPRCRSGSPPTCRL